VKQGRTALLLAAGKSTRIAPVVRDRPKPLIPVAGEPVLVRNLRWLVAQGIADVWINLHHLGDQIAAVVGDGSAFGARVRYSREEPLLGTAGAVRHLREHWTERFWVVYGDSLVNFSLAPMHAGHTSSGSALTIAVFNADEQISTGIAGGRVVVGADGRVVDFVEGGGRISPHVNAGVYLVEPEVVDLIPSSVPCDFARDVFPDLLARGVRVSAHVIDGYCLGLDTPEALARLNALIGAERVTPQ
jgi:NDP-sugar pyrophosphorylase family protein